MTTFLCADGRELTIKPVSRILTQLVAAGVRREMAEAGDPIEPPTYTVTTVAGVVETHPHDETTIQTDEDRVAWVAYTVAQARMHTEIERRITRAMLVDGVVGIDDVPTERIAYYKALGVEFPDDAGDRKVAFLQMEYLADPEDLTKLWIAIMRLSTIGVRGEEVAAAEESFRGPVEGPQAGRPADTRERLDV